MQIKATAASIAKNTGRSIITWEWTKKLLHWIIISAGTMSECVFLIASLWVSINANVHTFVLLFINEDTTKHITELATTAYVALPECIVGLAVVVTLSHIRMVMYNRRDFRAYIWSGLYGLPTLVFLVLSLVTLGNAVNNINFQMPGYLVVTRALAGYMFAFTSLLYTQVGMPQEKDRLAKKDTMLAELRAEKDTEISDLRLEMGDKISQLESLARQLNEKLESETTRLNAIISQQNQDLQKTKRQNDELVNAVNKSSEDALQAYSAECIDWLKSEPKSVNVEEITRFTGHSKRKVSNANDAGKFKHPGRNKELILKSSLVEWLELNPPTPAKQEQDTGPILRIVNQ